MISRVCLQCRLRLRTSLVRAPSRPLTTGRYSNASHDDVEQTYERLLKVTDDRRSPDLVEKLAHGYRDKPFPPKAPEKKPEMSPFLKKAHAKFSYPSATHKATEISGNLFKESLLGQRIVLHGFLAKPRKFGRLTSNALLYDSDMYHFKHYDEKYAVRVVSNLPELEEGQKHDPEVLDRHKRLTSTHVFAPVVVQGIMELGPTEKPELRLEEMWVVNGVQQGLIYTNVPEKTSFPVKDRHLQLRTEYTLWNALRTRHRALKTIRRVLETRKFLEVETPLLFKSTPEGAREFLVPTRWKDEKGDSQFYALPQSPQQYKQMLMASGVTKYYQIARCFRDEDLRADRQPEFTQLDLEMQWAKPEDVQNVIEAVIRALWNDILGYSVPASPFKRLSYARAMSNYGSDKPDVRFDKIHRITYRGGEETIQGFVLRTNPDAAPFVIDSIHTDLANKFSSSIEFKSYVANETTANGVPEHGLSATDIDDINESLGVEPNAIVVLWKMPRVYPFAGGSTPIGDLRRFLIEEGLARGVITPYQEFAFTWITDFPLFTPTTKASQAAGEGQHSESGFSATHHPFTAPMEEDFAFLDTDPLKVRAQHYDIVVNGVELGGGSRRIHDPELQRYILEDIIKVPAARMKTFEHLLHVLGSGCPPHAGIALGFDRLVALLVGSNSVRDVIAFPKNTAGKDMCVSSPSSVESEQLDVLGIQRKERKPRPRIVMEETNEDLVKTLALLRETAKKGTRE
ncbi:hypothetical protein EX30DRAFT_345031 [Ascodesmis nigricans]|uniref:Aminoacyl-transfer RNA synthetases class-II family profile domain-containing protein n=1 Tax=Ascodesmis nigricans TaxID=341454 RepID=A0A4S2MHC0_9PEZI|nr:hypothetical protein EX30DRAFT_345031 [Ascodesmis nigricans]